MIVQVSNGNALRLQSFAVSCWKMSHRLKFLSHIDMIEQLCNIKRADVLGFTKMVKCRFIQQNTLLDFLVRHFFREKNGKGHHDICLEVISEFMLIMKLMG